MTAYPLKIRIAGVVRVAFCSADDAFFAWVRVICKSDGCGAQPSVTLGVPIGKIEAGGSYMKGRWRIAKQRISKI